MSKKRSNDAYKDPQIVRSYHDKLYRVSIHKPNGDQICISPGFKRVDAADANVADQREFWAEYTKRNGPPPVRLKAKKKVKPAPPAPPADPAPGEQA